MARKKSKKSSQKNPAFWQWAVVAGAAFLLYQGLQHWLNPEKPSPEKRAVTLKTKPEKPAAPAAKQATPPPAPTPQPSSGPVPKWTFQSAARFLPADGYPDNYSELALGNGPSGLLAYAKTLPGKKPGPQGLTNTLPGFRAMLWNGKQYETKELDFEALKPALGGLKLVGPPQADRRAWIADGITVLPAKFFLNDETRFLVGFILIDAQGPRWASLEGEDGKAGIAAFLQGTTAATTRKVNKVERNGKHYIVVEKGSLDLAKPEAGYQWRVDAYAWNGKAFAFDKDLSKTLTQEKKNSE